MRLAWLLFLVILLIGESGTLFDLDSVSLPDSPVSAPRTENRISFAERLSRATAYFESFAFQDYRPFSSPKVSRRSLHRQALTRFFADLSSLRRSLPPAEKNRFPAPGESAVFDRIYALALTSHYISLNGQLPMAARDRFEPVSIYQLVVAGLSDDLDFPESVRRKVQQNEGLAVFLLQSRYAAARVVTFRQTFKMSAPLGGAELLGAEKLDLVHLEREEGLEQLQILLEAAIEAREILDFLGKSVPSVVLENLGPEPVALAEMWRKIDVSRLSRKFSPHPSHSLHRLASLFETLKRPLL